MSAIDHNLKTDQNGQPLTAAFDVVRGAPFQIIEDIVKNPAQSGTLKIDPETGRPEVGLQEQMLRDQTGYYMVKDGYAVPGDDEEKKRRRQQEELHRDMVEYAASITVDGITMTFGDVMDNLSTGINSLTHVSSIPLQPVSRTAMLYVDQNGQVVNLASVAQPPPGLSPAQLDAFYQSKIAELGLQQVDTAEQKAEIEDQNQMCYGGITTEDITLQDGSIVSKQASEFREAQKAELAEFKDVQQKLASGELTLDELQKTNPEMVEKLAEIEKTGELSSAQEGIVAPNGEIWDLPPLPAAPAQENTLSAAAPREPTPVF